MDITPRPTGPSSHNNVNQRRKRNQNRHHHHRLQLGKKDEQNGVLPSSSTSTVSSRSILALHGNRQTGQLFLGRVERLQKKLQKEFQLQMVAPDAPFPNPDDVNMQTWWNRESDDYIGLDETLAMVQTWNDKHNFVGILGFSQGARLCHLLALLHTKDPDRWFPNLKFVILVAGYDAPLPPQIQPHLSADGGPNTSDQLLPIPSLHVWGERDSLVLPQESEIVTKEYRDPTIYIHAGNHFVPTKGADMEQYVEFIQQSLLGVESSIKPNDFTVNVAASDEPGERKQEASKSGVQAATTAGEQPNESSPVTFHHDNPTADGPRHSSGDDPLPMQQEEVQALEAIYPEEFELKSSRRTVDDDDVFDFPIIYYMKLLPSDEDNNGTSTNWPPRQLTLQIQYPNDYPIDGIPIFTLVHENNSSEFPSKKVERLMGILHETATNGQGMPSVLSCIYAVREYLDAPTNDSDPIDATDNEVANHNNESDDRGDSARSNHPLVRASTPEAIEIGNLEGLKIAESLLGLNSTSSLNGTGHGSWFGGLKGGGSFGTYTIGLVGKPSAGKSTFFNAATAFYRQRGQYDGECGASMAAHPFTTIDPNVGYCLVPAPFGSCPEDDYFLKDGETERVSSVACSFGSTHGRDPKGRRFIPVLLKDVAGLVPGAYQGKGRGNQFLNDLTDATVLIHVVDASGTADKSGNKTVSEDTDAAEYSKPLDDLAWIRNELVEWVYSNLMAKWDTIVRKGRIRLAGMFSGYGQREAMVEAMLSGLENFLAVQYNRDHALDEINTWDECDVHRLVSLFLGVRFPMVLCLNKYDLPSAGNFAREIEVSLPIHGAHAGTPLSAKDEMNFVKAYISVAKSQEYKKISPPFGIWQCLTTAVEIREPVLVFPVSDMSSLAPMAGLNKAAVGDPSLPSRGMIRCITGAGGFTPSCWDTNDETYIMPSKSKEREGVGVKLRDVLLMKPGSTIEDVFNTLKRLGALGGEFVRAEASSGRQGDKPKPVPKHEIVSRSTCVIKIMSTKRTAWQH